MIAQMLSSDLMKQLVAMQLADRDPHDLVEGIADAYLDWMVTQHHLQGTEPPVSVRVFVQNDNGSLSPSVTMRVSDLVDGIAIAAAFQMGIADFSSIEPTPAQAAGANLFAPGWDELP